MINTRDYSRIVIYQFGKCGSTSLMDLFKKDNKVFHTHDFIEDNKNTEQKKQLVITVVRNIFDRNISAYFQNINNKGHFWYHPSVATKYSNFDLKELKIDDTIEFFKKKNIVHTQNVIANWYNNFTKKIGINIFLEKFDFENKYKIYEDQSNKYTVLVLRYEDIKQWDDIFAKIFVQKLGKLPFSNISEKKPLIMEVFSEFKKKYTLSKEEIELILNVDVMQHFYTDEEKEGFIKKYISLEV